MEMRDRSLPMLLYRMDMRPMWLLSGQTAGRVVRRPVVFGTMLALAGALERLARYFLVADSVRKRHVYYVYLKTPLLLSLHSLIIFM